MFKILIVDDEPLVRATFKNVIDWEKFGFSITEEASNGAEALEKFRKDRTDIVVTDIKMPEMDGLTLIREIRKESPATKMIALSAYDEYHLVRDAFKYGVHDYFLKTDSEPEELLLTLQKVCRDMDSENHSKAMLADNIYILQGDFLKRIIWDRNMSREQLEEMLERLDMNVSDRYLAIACVVIDRTEGMGHDAKTNDKNPGNELFMKLFTEELQKGAVGFMTQLSQDEYVVLFHEPMSGEAHEMVRTMEAFFMRLQQRSAAQAGIGFSAGVSRIFTDIRDCYIHYSEAVSILEYRFFNGRGKLLFCGDTARPGNHTMEKAEDMDCSSVIAAVREGNPEKLQAGLTAMNEKIRHCGYSRNEVIYSVYLKIMYELAKAMDEYGIDTGSLRENGVDPVKELLDLPTIDDIHIWFGNYTYKLIESVRSKRSSQHKNAIVKAKQYVAMNYMKKMTLEEVARFVYLNPSYFSKIFTEGTGKNFTEYVNEVRVDKAKALMAGNSRKVYEVSEAVGFESPEYFCRIFKKITGKSPSDYNATVEKFRL